MTFQFRHPSARCLIICALVTAPPLTTASPQQPRTLDRSVLDRLRARQAVSKPLEVVGSGATRQLPATSQSVSLDPGHYVKTAVPLETRKVDGRLRYVFPVRFTGFDATGEHVVDLAAVLEVENGAMRLDSEGKMYRASALVGVDDKTDPDVQRQLAPGTVMQISADRADVDRPDVDVAHTGSPYQRIELTSQSPDTAVQVTLRFRREKMQAWLGVMRPHIELTLVPRTLPGLGAGEATIGVQVSEDAGARTRTVNVSFMPGSADPSQVEVSPAKPASVRIRTAGLRTAQLSATSTGLVGASEPIGLAFPFSLLVAALVGAVLGTVILSLKYREKRALFACFFVGVVVACAILFGVNLTGASLPLINHELGVAVVAAIPGVMWFLKNLMGSKEKEA